MKKTLPAVGVFMAVSLASAPSDAVMIHQLQTFEDPHGWVIGAGPVLGSPTPVPVVPGGPGGVSDPFLSITATGGSGPGSRLSVSNFDEWAGDYLAAGIDAIRMDVTNSGSTDLFLRLVFFELGPVGPVNAAITSAPHVVPAGSDWHSITFHVSVSALTAFVGTAVGALSNTGELRLFHNPLPFFEPGNNPPVVANLGVDNMESISAVPEPSSWVLLLGALAGGFTGLRRPVGR